jgi:hypothetical protein
MRRTLLCIAAALVAACASAGPEVQPNKPKALSPEEMMKKMTELGTPGHAHQRLDALIGKFKVTMHSWDAPDAKEQISEATSSGEWILGGRFVQEKFDGSMMGQPFNGIGLTGYDNSTSKYQSFWIDSMGTAMMPASSGTIDATGTVITSSRTYVDCMSGATTTTREVMTIQDKDHHTFEWFQPGPDGKEFRMMKIDYVRIP